MTHDSRSRRTRAFAAIVVALAVALSASGADARAGSSSSSGSRGSRTYSAPPATSTAPSTAAPMERSMAQPTAPRPSAPMGAPAPAPSRGLFGGGGFMSGLMGGLIGAGIGSLLFGGGFFNGLGSFAGILGFILQIVLVVFLVRLAMRFFRNRSAGPAPAYASAAAEPLRRDGNPMGGGPLGGAPLGGAPLGGGLGGGAARPRDEIGIGPQDYQEFERLLISIQTAYAAEDLATLRGLATPEMLSYFSEDLAANASRGVANRISDVRLLQGDLSEAWREGNAEYVTVAMRFSLIDVTVDRATGRVVEGDPNRPTEAAELWTFVRSQGGRWILSAIQQTR
ncbi:Tim44 domain-containing protein [Azospirillum sp.]|uniref:Tim44 domain-containing protein n=1 Tax=Azospirillum sp. TaxID=34012 RepID=UPI003D717271